MKSNFKLKKIIIFILYFLHSLLYLWIMDQIVSAKGREFVCACGKNYLSYAALFTHIKQKHQGKVYICDIVYQAPGPIIRPRSQRKRGRPRKNPMDPNQHKSEQSQSVQNGIFSENINNNNNIGNEQNQNKTMRAAQLLQCGKFLAFQTYRPESQNSIMLKKESDFQRPGFKQKNTFKEGSFKKVGSSVKLEDQGNQSCKRLSAKSLSISQLSTGNIDIIKQCQESLKKIFQHSQPPHTLTQQQLTQFLTQHNLPSSQNPSIQQTTNLSQISISHGLQLILKQCKQFLQTPSYNQLAIFIILLKQFLKNNDKNNENTENKNKNKNDKNTHKNLLQSQLVCFLNVDLMCQFIDQYLKKKVKEMGLSGLCVFQKQNPMIILTYVNNWISVQEQMVSLRKVYAIDGKVKIEGGGQKMEDIRSNDVLQY